MSYLDQSLVDLGAECQEDAKPSLEVQARRKEQLAGQLATTPVSETSLRARLLLSLSRIEVRMEQKSEAWNHAWDAFQIHLEDQNWEKAVESCDVLFSSGTEDALPALGHALWLGITFPIDPSLTIRQLIHVIDETPEDSDGAAVAAAVAAYVAELRSEGNQHGELSLKVGQLLNDVARRHGDVQNQREFDLWFRKLELHDAAKLMVRMRNIIDVLVQDQWWIDRKAIQETLPADC